jgi:hypothetical protein
MPYTQVQQTRRISERTTMNMMHRAAGVFAIALAIPAMSGCSSTPQIASRWRTDTVMIDGNAGEWERVPSYAEKQRFTVSAQHDSEYLYLCLTTADQGLQMQLNGAGLIVWFDPNGGTKKVFGINFPLGRHGGEPPSMDILGPDEGDRYRLSTVEHSGIQVKIGRGEQRSLAYELKVPLRNSKSHVYAVGARPGVPVGIGIVTPDTKREMKREGSDRSGPPEGMEGGHGGPPGGMGGGSGGPPGGRGGGPGGRGPGGGPGERPEPLDFWMKVTLTHDP